MTPRQFERFLERDGGRCLHCGATEGLVPQHRINRGMGGSRKGDKASNVIVLCALYNGLIESDAEAQKAASTYGWKLSPWEDPELEPVYDRSTRTWFLLGNDYTRTLVEDHELVQD